MSRLGKKRIDIPNEVKVAIIDFSICIEGPGGKLSYKFAPPIKVNFDSAIKKVLVDCDSTEKKDKALHGLTRSTIANMVNGVAKGYEKQLEINGVGYNAKVQGKQLILQLGFTHLITIDIPEGLIVTCPTQTAVLVKGIDKERVGQFAAEIRFKRPVEPYNLKGIKYRDEVVRRKAGKTFVSGTT